MSYGVRFMVGAVCRGAVCRAHRVLCCGTSYVQCACSVSRIDALRGTLRVRSPRDWNDYCQYHQHDYQYVNSIFSTLTAISCTLESVHALCYAIRPLSGTHDRAFVSTAGAAGLFNTEHIDTHKLMR